MNGRERVRALLAEVERLGSCADGEAAIAWDLDRLEQVREAAEPLLRAVRALDPGQDVVELRMDDLRDLLIAVGDVRVPANGDRISSPDLCIN